MTNKKHLSHNKIWVTLGIRGHTFDKLKKIKEAHGITFDELIRELLEK